MGIGTPCLPTKVRQVAPEHFPLIRNQRIEFLKIRFQVHQIGRISGPESDHVHQIQKFSNGKLALTRVERHEDREFLVHLPEPAPDGR